MANVLQWNSSTNSFSVSGASSVTQVVGEGIDNNFSVPQTFGAGILQTGAAGAGNQSPLLNVGDAFSDFIASGVQWAIPSSASLTTTMSSGSAYLNGVRTLVPAISGNAFPASNDTYVSFNNSGVPAYQSVANGATAPTPESGYVQTAKVVTNASTITSVDYLISTSPTPERFIYGLINDPTGNNISSNTTAIINAAASANGNYALWLPENYTVIVNTLNFTVPVKFRIDGTIQIANGQNAGIMNLTGSGNHIYGNGTLNGNRANQSTAGAGIGCSSGGISFSLIEDITITECFNWPINLTNINDTDVVRVSMTNSGNSPQFMTAANDSHLTDCFISGIDDGGFAFYENCVDCSATGNTVTGCTNAGISVYVDNNTETPSNTITIAENVIYGNKSSALAVTSATASTTPTNTKVLITANICVDNNTAGLSGSSDIQFSSAQSVFVEGNLLMGNGNTAGSGEYPYGIYIDPDSSFIFVKNNTIGNVGSANSNGSCIFIDEADNCSIENNTGFDDQATSTTSFVVGGTTGAGCVIGSNTLVGNLASGGHILELNTANSPKIYNQDNGNGQTEFSEALAIPYINAENSSTTNAPTSGSVTLAMPLQGNGKQVILTFNAYENDTTTNQTINFPTAFTVTPLIVGNNTGLTITASTTGVTISAPDNTTTYSGTAVIMGN